MESIQDALAWLNQTIGHVQFEHEGIMLFLTIMITLFLFQVHYRLIRLNNYMELILSVDNNTILEESKKQTKLLERLIEIMEEPERRQEINQLVKELIDRMAEGQEAQDLEDEQKK